MATEQMAQMFGQLQQAQLAAGEPATDVPTEFGNAGTAGAAQGAKTTYDARDFQTKAFSKMILD